MNIDFQGNIAVEIDPVTSEGLDIAKDVVKKSLPMIMSMLGYVLLETGWGAIIFAVISAVVEFIFTKKKAEERKAEALRKLQQEVFPKIIMETEHKLNDVLFEYFEEIKEKNNERINREKELIEKALDELKKEKSMKQEEKERVRAELLSDLEELQKMKTFLK